MPKTRVILELGSGNDLHGSDYTKAALRAVQDALHHSSLSFVRTLKVDKTKLDVEVTIGVQRPEQVDLDKIKASLPLGNVTVKAVKGGLDVADPENNDRRGHRQRSHRGSDRDEVIHTFRAGFGPATAPRPASRSAILPRSCRRPSRIHRASDSAAPPPCGRAGYSRSQAR